MTKKKTSPKFNTAPQAVPAKTPRTLTIVLAIIASIFVTVLLYVLYFVFVDYLESASPGRAAVLVGLLLFAVIAGPGILVAAIIWPKLRQK